MNETVNKFLLAVDKSVPEMHLKLSEFTYSTCGPVIKSKEIIQNLCKRDIQNIFTKKILIKLVFK